MVISKNKVYGKIVEQINKETGIKKEVVDAVCRHLFSFIRSKIVDTKEIRAIRIPKLGIIAPIKTGLKHHMYYKDPNNPLFTM